MTATDGDKDRPENVVYFLTGQGIDLDRPDQSKFDINKTTGEIFVLKVRLYCIYSSSIMLHKKTTTAAEFKRIYVVFIVKLNKTHHILGEYNFKGLMLS